MAKYENLYLISPNLFVAQLDQDLSELCEQQSRLDGLVAELADAMLERKVYDITSNARHVGKWYYDARFPNYVLSNLYAAEKEQSGKIKRWVGPERVLELLLSLDRSVQYDFEVNIINFKNEEIRQEFVLTVDDDEVPWLSDEMGSYGAIIPEDLRPRTRDRTRIAIGPRREVPPPEAAPGEQYELITESTDRPCSGGPDYWC